MLGSGEHIWEDEDGLGSRVETEAYTCFFLQYEICNKNKGLWELGGGTGNSASQLGYKVWRKGGTYW